MSAVLSDKGMDWIIPDYCLRPQFELESRTLACELGSSVGVARVLLQRGVGDAREAAEFLHPTLARLTPPDGMLDRDCAADRLAHAVRSKETIVVFGDYDVDGSTSAVLLADVLEALGATVHVLLANRFAGGYGLSDAAVQRIVAMRPGLVVTCDCGSTDHERVAWLAARGVDTVVIDHHQVPEEPLPARAFINPHRPQCSFAYKGMASVGLAFSLAAAVRAALGVSLDLRRWLDLVALGTVADVAPLDGDNRRLVRAGLGHIGSGRARPGVQALCHVARLDPGAPVGAADIGFRLAPRINAPGRLGDPSILVSLLRARDVTSAMQLARHVDELNTRRRELEQQVTDEACAQVASYLEQCGEPTPRVVLAAGSWPKGVVGITAARLMERFGVPAAVVALEGGVGHASCRGPEGFSWTDALRACADLLSGWGGHHRAAGFGLEASNVEALRERLHQTRLSASAGDSRRYVDLSLDDGACPLFGEQDLSQLEPLGVANEEPVFASADAKVRQVTRMGEHQQHVRMQLQTASGPLQAVGFSMPDLDVRVGDSVVVVGPLRAESWRGVTRVQMHMTCCVPHRAA